MPIISGESGEFLSSFEPEPPRVAERVRGTLSRAGRFAPLPGGPRLSTRIHIPLPDTAASRAGRSAGRSLSWHGRGRGFKSHPVHSSWLRMGPNSHLSESRSRDGLIGTTALAIVPRLPGDLAGELRVSRSSSRSGLTILKAPKPVAAVSGGETWITKSRL